MAVKENTFVALGKIGDQRVIPEASRYAQSETDWHVREGALSYLARINTSEATAALWDAYERRRSPDVALCLVQVGVISVLGDVRRQLNCRNLTLGQSDGGGRDRVNSISSFPQYATSVSLIKALSLGEDDEAQGPLRRRLPRSPSLR